MSFKVVFIFLFSWLIVLTIVVLSNNTASVWRDSVNLKKIQINAEDIGAIIKAVETNQRSILDLYERKREKNQMAL